MKRLIAFDIGGTAIKYGLIDGQGKLLQKESVPTEAQKGGPEIVKKVTAIAERLIRQAGASAAGICISTAGMVDTKTGSVFYASPLIPDYTGTAWKAILEKRFSIPCEVENDVNCAGLAESRSGAAKGCAVACMLTIGTGIGGCLLLDGQVFHGSSNSACEIGYLYMDGSDFQTLGAASVLTKNVAERKQEPVEQWDGHRIFAEAQKEDPVCIHAIDEMVDILGKGIATVCYVVNPETVVLGGGIMAQEAYLKERIQKAVYAHLRQPVAGHTQIVFARHQNDAGMLGAFYHFCDLHGKIE